MFAVKTMLGGMGETIAIAAAMGHRGLEGPLGYKNIVHLSRE